VVHPGITNKALETELGGITIRSPMKEISMPNLVVPNLGVGGEATRKKIIFNIKFS
jgi:hypothetical protein